MAKLLKKHAFSLRLERHFTKGSVDAFDLIHFNEVDDNESGFETPDNWSKEASELLVNEAAAPSIPAYTKLREENTVPSWLWRRTAEGRLRSSENSSKQIFHRVAGAAAYAGWKKGVFADEAEARIFFDEVRYLLAQRFIAIEPRELSTTGLDWAYGFDGKPNVPPAKQKNTTSVRNSSIDALLSGDVNARQKWQKLLETGAKTGYVSLSFADVAADWNSTSCQENIVRSAVDLFAFRRDDGAVAVNRLLQAVRLLTILLELLGKSCMSIGLNNLSPLLMSQAFAYDSEAGRTTASALAAVVTAEACATSAQLAGLLGPSLDFAANREPVLRALRNYRRAAYGDRNDYEKISVLPVPLELGPGVDLALIAAARRRWDEALELAQQHGLRFAYFTDLAPVSSLAFFMESVTQGIDPMQQLSLAVSSDGDVYERKPHSAVPEALLRLGYGADICASVVKHIVGSKTLEHSPAIDHAILRERGFNEEAIERVEQYLPFVNDIRLAFTPSVLGEEFVRDTLQIPADQASDPTFDLLKYLGFSISEIEAANFYCYGSGTARGAKGLRAEHLGIFASREEITTSAQIRMAAAVQSFISGDVALRLDLPEGTKTADHERLLLDAWRQGIKSVTLEWDVPLQDIEEEIRTSRPVMPTPTIHSKQQYSAPLRSALRSRSKASSELVGMKGREGKSGQGKKHRPDKS